MLKIEKKIFIISFFLTALGVIVFFSLWNINSSLVWGWVIGCTSVIFNFLILVFLTKSIFRNSKKQWIVLFVVLKFVFTILFNASLFALIVFINKKHNNVSFFKTGLEGINYPINLLTYLSGISVIGLSIFLTNVLPIKRRRGIKNGQNN